MQNSHVHLGLKSDVLDDLDSDDREYPLNSNVWILSGYSWVIGAKHSCLFGRLDYFGLFRKQTDARVLPGLARRPQPHPKVGSGAWLRVLQR